MATLFGKAKSTINEHIKNIYSENILEIEVKEATKTLGIKPENLLIYRYPVIEHPQNRQKILEDIVLLREKINPDLVFMPSKSDIHQDHRTVYEEGLRAFKQASILGYELPGNNLTFSTTAFVYLEEKHIVKKLEAFKKYKSQFHRPYANDEFIRSLARTRGVQIGTHYAEAFEAIRWIIK